MKNLTRQQFEEFAKHGSIRKPTGQTPPGEDLCESFFEAGVVNGYSLADICRFYAHTRGYQNDLLRQGRTNGQALDEAHELFVHHAIYFGATVFDAAPGVGKRTAAKKPARRKAVQPRKHVQD